MNSGGVKRGNLVVIVAKSRGKSSLSTNFYADLNDPEPWADILNEDGLLHLGKRSMGWAFQLRQYKEHGINDLDDLVAIISGPENNIIDEYSAGIPLENFVDIVKNPLKSKGVQLNKQGKTGLPSFDRDDGICFDRKLAVWRTRNPHSDDPWDLVPREFS